jgi:hypothetical protein
MVTEVYASLLDATRTRWHLQLLTLFRRGVFFKIGEMVTNQKVLSNQASDKSRVSRVGSIITAVSRAFQKGGGRLLSEQGLALYTRL